MSFTVIVPCNCIKENKINYPDFKDKLTINHGEIDLKVEYIFDLKLEKKFDKWKFCEHDGVAIEFSMAQSIIHWKKHVEEKYPNQFPNFEKFIPKFNMYITSDYDKERTIAEIDELDKLENFVHSYRFNQFKKLLETAIKLDQEIYW